jgi:hypothetical protein
LMRCGIAWSRGQDSGAQSFRSLDPPGVEFRQNLLKCGLSTLLGLCHRNLEVQREHNIRRGRAGCDFFYSDRPFGLLRQTTARYEPQAFRLAAETCKGFGYPISWLGRDPGGNT